MIAPDTKDWTWVLQRRCPECGFDAASTSLGAVSELVRANAQEWARLEGAGMIGPGRPNPSTWSSLEYACHVRDVYRRYDERLRLMLTQDDPVFPNWDQDASADEERYDEQQPERVVSELQVAAEQLAQRLAAVTAEDADRPGRRSDGAHFTVTTISRYMIHDPIHHVWDVTKPRH